MFFRVNGGLVMSLKQSMNILLEDMKKQEAVIEADIVIVKHGKRHRHIVNH